MNKVQVLLYTSYLHIIGGIETFVFNFVDLMGEYYDIGLYTPHIPPETKAKLMTRIPVFTTEEEITCNVLIMIRMMDPIPKNIKYKKSIRMCHATKSNPTWFIREDCDKVIHVSEASKKTFRSKGDVIYNPLIKTTKKALLLTSATRVPATDKGKNAERMLNLARMLNRAHIPFLWFNFSDNPLKDAPKGFINVGSYQDLQPYISKADYLVQLSDQEGFGYSVVEALSNNTAVICTPFDTTKELGVKDGVNGYVVPFDLNFDVTKLLDVPQFEYEYDNKQIATKWKSVIGSMKASKTYKPPKKLLAKVLKSYHDIEQQRELSPGEIIEVTRERADAILKVGDLIEVLEN